MRIWLNLLCSNNPLFCVHSDEESEDDSDSDEDEDQFLRKTGDYLTSSQQLPKNSLNYQKVRNANKERPTQVRGKIEFGSACFSEKP